MKLRQKLFVVAVLVIVIITSGLAAMRFADGPYGMLSGGAFSSGEVRSGLSDWSFLAGREVIEFQTMAPATARTIWLVVVEQKLYFVSGYMNTLVGKIWKQWPGHIVENNAILIRVDGAIYPQRLKRLLDEPVVPAVMRKFSKKYGLGSEDASEDAILAMVGEGDVWLFEVVADK